MLESNDLKIQNTLVMRSHISKGTIQWPRYTPGNFLVAVFAAVVDFYWTIYVFSLEDQLWRFDGLLYVLSGERQAQDPSVRQERKL
jgi:hypothetical protein